MNQKDYFVLGCKFFGIYCFVISVPYILGVIQLFIAQDAFPDEYAGTLMVTKMVTWLIPVAFVILGVYLIKSGRFIHELAYPGKSGDLDLNLEGKFVLFLKIFGMYLLIEYIPNFLRSLSSYIVYTNAPKYLNLLQDKRFFQTNILPSAVAILLGFYLLRSGKVFLRLGFSNAVINKAHD